MTQAFCEMLKRYQSYPRARRQADVERQSLAMQQMSKQMVSIPRDVVVHLQSSTHDSGVFEVDSEATKTSNASGGDCRRFARRSRQQGRWMHLRVPLRFCEQIWQFSAARSVGGWMFQLQTYWIRPDDAPIFGLVRVGDLMGVKAMFDKGEASPMDCDSMGWTLLGVSASC